MRMFLIVCAALLAAYAIIQIYNRIQANYVHSQCIERIRSHGLEIDEFAHAGCRLAITLGFDGAYYR